MEHWDTIILGGGASGLAAAAVLAQSGRGERTLVLEQAERPGKKLLATGNGRCNLYHTGLSAERFSSQSTEALSQSVQALLRAKQPVFWQKLGLLTSVQEEGRVYPACQQASAVLELLRAVAERGGVALRCGQPAASVVRRGEGFLVTTAGGEAYSARQVILATGGKAAPRLGATGDGYALAGQLGHSCTELRPGLVPVRCVNPSRVLKGVRNRSKVSLYLGERLLLTRFGEVQFTEYGVSGIVIMDLSSHMEPGRSYTLVLDLLPEVAAGELTRFLREKAQAHPDQKAEFLLLGVVKRQLGEVILRASRVDGKKRRLGSLTEAELSVIVQRIKSWSLRTEGTLSWEHAQVTCGGVPLEEIDPDTFQSRLVPGLYLTGELLDAAGDCGGFNLAWAFGSGILAGRAIAAQ
ncbi:MAG: aminoacetone oxidase family FAD-binding enzyme [Oscillospiraceae bacterium]|nr:aminoacetone oxidase family FAD-binding enzyme [Oscillospiraceae bacterium]